MTEAQTETPAEAKKGSGWLNVAVDYGPLVVFLGAYNYFSPDSDAIEDKLVLSLLTTEAVIYSTGAFIIASVIALAVSKLMLGKVSPMLWFSTILIVVFGGFTIWTGEEWVIQAKPTVLYALFGVALLIGWRMGKALLKILLETAFEGLSDEGWLKLSRNWGVFFLLLAALNQVLVYHLSFGDWLWAKLWVFMPLTFLFTFTQIPMLLKHGLDVGENASGQAD